MEVLITSAPSKFNLLKEYIMNSEVHIDDLPDDLLEAIDEFVETNDEPSHVFNLEESDKVRKRALSNKPLAERLATDTKHFGGYKRRTRPTKKKRRKK